MLHQALYLRIFISNLVGEYGLLYINPENLDISNVFSNIVSDLIIIKDETGLVYWPQFGLNTIGNLTSGKGYQTKMTNNATLTIEGTLIPLETELNLTEGWSIIGYFYHKNVIMLK